jgi:N-acetylneuraminate synthase
MIKVTAEIGINANGDLAIAKKLIDIATSAGCDYVKFQKRDIDSCYTKYELDMPRESAWGMTTREQKHGIEFDVCDYVVIDDYCAGKIGWFVSPWDVISIDVMDQFQTPFIKIPSARITDIVYLNAIARLKTPVILSTGMSTLDEIDRAVVLLGENNIQYILHCTSTYPTKPEEININCIQTLKEIYPGIKIGFSNHYPGLNAMELAVAHGAKMIEFHITPDRAMYGSDQSASIEPRGLFEFMEKLKLTNKMMGDGKKKIYDSEVPIMEKLRR